jgi:hypothetical protein
MELRHLREIVEGLNSLAEIEKEHPVLGAQLLKFVEEVRDCCSQAYGRLSQALGTVRSLPDAANPAEISVVLSQINKAPDSKWFKEVSGICDRLAALATTFQPQFSKQLEYTSPFGTNWQDSSTHPGATRYEAHYQIAPLFSLLQQHERELKDDIRSAIAQVQAALAQTDRKDSIDNARQFALQVQREIDGSMDEIAKLTYQIAGTSSAGTTAVLSPELLAEQALRRPERVLILNMFFLLIAFGLGATAFQYLRIYQFILLTGFSFTAVVIVNALYLRSIEKLSEQSFLKLMELALLKFFAPLTKRRGNP